MSRRGNGEGSIYQRTDGRWCASVSLPFGKRKVIYGSTRGEVAKKLTGALKRKDAGLPFVPERFTTGDWVTHWLGTVVKVHREPTTYAKYETIIRRYLLPDLGKVPLARLTPEHLERWQEALGARGASAENRRSAMLRLGTALQLAFERGYVDRNVARLVEKPRVDCGPKAPPDLATLRRLLHTIRDDPKRALVLVALGCSLRRAECLGLHWSDIDLEHRILRVNRRVNRVGRDQGLLVRPAAKTRAGVRQVHMPRLVAEALRAQRTSQLAERLAAGEAWQTTGFVFTSAKGTVLEPRKVDLYFAEVRQRAALGHYTFHQLRHDFAGLLLQSDVPGRVVSEMMGHSTYRITADLYQHVPDVLQRAAADRLDELLG